MSFLLRHKVSQLFLRLDCVIPEELKFTSVVSSSPFLSQYTSALS